MENICYNCSYCKDIEIDIYYCSYNEDEFSNPNFPSLNIINFNRKMCDIGLKELIEREPN